ncbi:dihydrolipoamide dehydrogenase [Sinobaca qinghaiensis]|uniref:Dihydrolipoyl dehydrogenase n=1 Tax=Sinobaca qinghaiensis TaxID=342944 RepID=A0A419V397_9BACL|nr:dihydrolipoyl dehydrogenase [Sinobaca qinghaiensis]RKD72944.1 dihydrolipoamide dehydrogenase [Sinobaca qinghaiensis]
MAEEYDLVILGAGTGGYVAAIKAAQAGLKTAIVEKDKVGGTCLHKGCIPSKSLLKSAEMFQAIQHSESYGITADNVTLAFDKVQKRKNDIVDKLHRGVQHLMQKGKIDVFDGYGRILGPSIFSPSAGTISVERTDKEENTMLIPKQVIIATGSRPAELEGLPTDGNRILHSEHVLELKKLPASIVIIGGGVIGVEWASMFNDFGTEVTLIEYAERILPGEDGAVSKAMQKALENKGVKILTGTKVKAGETEMLEEQVTIHAVDNSGNDQAFEAEQVLVSIGRKANVEDIGLSNTDIEIKNGVIEVNGMYQTKESHIYAIGDVIGGLQLAHVASKEGAIAVDHILGRDPLPLDNQTVPRCIYSSPEASSIGMSQEEADKKGLRVKTSSFPFQAIGKALVNGNTEGFVKIIIDEDTDDLVGVHMIGSGVTELISEAAMAKILDASHLEIKETIHPHPSLSESFGEAVLAVDGLAVHS